MFYWVVCMKSRVLSLTYYRNRLYHAIDIQNQKHILQIIILQYKKNKIILAVIFITWKWLYSTIVLNNNGSTAKLYSRRFKANKAFLTLVRHMIEDSKKLSELERWVTNVRLIACHRSLTMQIYCVYTMYIHYSLQRYQDKNRPIKHRK